MLQMLGLLSGLLAASAYVPYIISILRGRTKPERASWLIWAVLAAIAFFSQLDKGATFSLWLVVFDSLGTFVILALSIKRGVGGFARRDKIALLIAALGLLVWYFTNEALYALLLVILVDATAQTLTTLKAFKDPHSESPVAWSLGSLAGLAATFSVGSFNIPVLAYPIYIFLANASAVLAIILGKRINKHKKS